MKEIKYLWSEVILYFSDTIGWWAFRMSVPYRSKEEIKAYTRYVDSIKHFMQQPENRP